MLLRQCRIWRSITVNRWTEMNLFVEIVETGSLSRAAAKLGMSNAAASRHLAALEERLRIRLVERNTRHLFITEPGQEFFRRSKAILADLRETERAVSARRKRLAGPLRIAASLDLFTRCVMPALAEFLVLHPDVVAQAETAGDDSELNDTDIDIAIRVREPATGRGGLRQLARTRQILAASPDYLHRARAPQRPQDLAEHALLLSPDASRSRRLRFQRGQQKESIAVHAVLEANDLDALKIAALDGMGILLAPQFTLLDDLRERGLSLVLAEWGLPLLSVELEFNGQKPITDQVNAFADFIAQHFASERFEKLWTDDIRAVH